MKICGVLNYLDKKWHGMNWVCVRQARQEYQRMTGPWYSNPRQSHVVLIWYNFTPMKNMRIISWFPGKANRKLFKGKKHKNNFITNIIFTEWYTNLPVNPESKKRHHLYGRVAPTKLVFCPKVFKRYYKNYSGEFQISTVDPWTRTPI